MPLQAGARLSHYDVTTLIAKAHGRGRPDQRGTKLDRDVALEGAV